MQFNCSGLQADSSGPLPVGFGGNARIDSPSQPTAIPMESSEWHLGRRAPQRCEVNRRCACAYRPESQRLLLLAVAGKDSLPQRGQEAAASSLQQRLPPDSVWCGAIEARLDPTFCPRPPFPLRRLASPWTPSHYSIRFRLYYTSFLFCWLPFTSSHQLEGPHSGRVCPLIVIAPHK